MTCPLLCSSHELLVIITVSIKALFTQQVVCEWCMAVAVQLCPYIHTRKSSVQSGCHQPSFLSLWRRQTTSVQALTCWYVHSNENGTKLRSLQYTYVPHIVWMGPRISPVLWDEYSEHFTELSLRTEAFLFLQSTEISNVLASNWGQSGFSCILLGTDNQNQELSLKIGVVWSP